MRTTRNAQTDFRREMGCSGSFVDVVTPITFGVGNGVGNRDDFGKTFVLDAGASGVNRDASPYFRESFSVASSLKLTVLQSVSGD